MVECRCVFVVRNREGMMYAAMIVGHGIDRRVALHQDEASPGCVEEHHMPVWCGGQMPAADDLRVELGAFRNVAHGNAEVSNRLDRNHLTSPHADSLSSRTAYLQTQGRSPLAPIPPPLSNLVKITGVISLNESPRKLGPRPHDIWEDRVARSVGEL